ncbi:MAG: hypothetical protein H0V15_02115 [Solirubrobacterales bacterium]|nr:hypothetical protein [Solirubrobacterales bacterium]
MDGAVAVGLVIILASVAAWIVPGVIAILKGHLVWGILGIVLFAPIGWVGAAMLAKPDSWWARNRYSDEKKAEALKRNPPGPAPALAVVAAAGTDASQDWKCLICGQVSATRVAAESHVRGSHPPAPVETSVEPV